MISRGEGDTCAARIAKHVIAGLPIFCIVVVAWGLCLAFLAANPHRLLVFDDSYITLRFASNFFKHGGITFDGQHYLAGATSPLHIALTAALGLVFDLQSASLLVGILAFCLCAVVVYVWALQVYSNKVVAVTAGLLVASNGWLVVDALNGLETTTFMLWSLLTFYLFSSRERKPYYVVPLVLAIMTRPEGWFVAASLWLWQGAQYLEKKDARILRSLRNAFIGFAILCLPYVAFSLHTVGQLLPSTVFAKAFFFAEMNTPLPERHTMFLFNLARFCYTLLFPAPYLLLVFAVFDRRVARLPYLWFYAALFYICYFVFFPGAIAHYWGRYQHIFIPIVIIAVSGGAAAMVERFRASSSRLPVVVFVILYLIYNQSIGLVDAGRLYAGAIASTQSGIVDLAFWLKRHTRPDAVIAAHDVGAVGYFSEREIVDLVGLVNPEVRPYYAGRHSWQAVPLGRRKVFRYLEQKKPDYLVMFEDWDPYFSFLGKGGNGHFKKVFTSNRLFPNQAKYTVYRCSWPAQRAQASGPVRSGRDPTVDLPDPVSGNEPMRPWGPPRSGI